METKELIAKIDAQIAALKSALDGKIAWVGISPEWTRGITPLQLLALCDHYGSDVSVCYNGFETSIHVENVTLYAKSEVATEQIPKPSAKEALANVVLAQAKSAAA